ncbi:hypothetical protein D3C86_2180220 [compost metagenome]
MALAGIDIIDRNSAGGSRRAVINIVDAARFGHGPDGRTTDRRRIVLADDLQCYFRVAERAVCEPN